MTNRRAVNDELRRAVITGDTFDVLYQAFGPTMQLGDVCEILGVSRKTGYNRLQAGTWPIRSRKVMGRWQSATGDVAAFIDSRKVAEPRRVDPFKGEIP